MAVRLASEGDRFRETVAFHAQQAVEKYLKAVLVYYQVEFRKTHDIEQLLYMVREVAPSLAEELMEARWLTPFGVDIRYPRQFPQVLPGDVARAVRLAQTARQAVMSLLGPILPADTPSDSAGLGEV